jgi:hypothetical protein
VPDLVEEIRETVKDTVKDAAQQLSDATRDAVQQVVQQSLLQLIEMAKTLAEQAITGSKSAAAPASMATAPAEPLAASGASAMAGEPNVATPAADAAPQRKGGGFLRYLLLGLIIGGLVAYFGQRDKGGDGDLGEENWIEVKHDNTGPAQQDATKPTPGPAAAAPEPSSVPSQEELDARASDH